MIKRTIDRILALLFFWRSYKVGYAVFKENRSRQLGIGCSPIGEEAPAYWRVPVSAFGRRAWLLLTPAEFERATTRAQMQSEDCKLPGSRVAEALWPVE